MNLWDQVKADELMFELKSERLRVNGTEEHLLGETSQAKLQPMEMPLVVGGSKGKDLNRTLSACHSHLSQPKVLYGNLLHKKKKKTVLCMDPWSINWVKVFSQFSLHSVLQ